MPKVIESENPRDLPALHTWIVPPESAGQRLDQFLVQQLESISRSRIQLLLEQGHVLVNGNAAKPSLRLRGDEGLAPMHPTEVWNVLLMASSGAIAALSADCPARYERHQ